MADYTWKPIDDLDESWSDMASAELQSLASIWREQSERLERGDALKHFNEKLGREWAIETGIIENLYTIERGVTQLLIEKGIEASLMPYGTTDRPAEQIVEILKDHEDVLEGLFDFVANRRDLSTSYIKQLHQALTRHQDTVDAINGLGRRVDVPLLRGDWKNLPNNPTKLRGAKDTHEYCPPEHVKSEMDRLVALHSQHLVKRIPPEVEAAWLHHRFTQIHPFQDGNGRVARALASIVFIREKWFPLVIHGDSQRDEYLTALENADYGDLKPLVSLFSKIQKRAFLRALSLSEDVLHDSSPLTDVISAATDRLKTRKRLRVEQMQLKSFEIAEGLESIALRELESIASTLNQELHLLDPNYHASAQHSSEDNDFWFKKQIVQIARQLNYYADTRTYSSWVRLKIREERQAELIISYHALGVEFFGIMAISAFIEYRDKTEETATSVEGPYAVSEDVFQFSYKEDEQEIAARFEKWLKDVLLIGLDTWRRQL
ncbi:MAG TPA: Fic family protein [Pyrinomonadaceae bacterium]|nr:Fic family protein [Pyrinomonadaceae bacterium]